MILRASSELRVGIPVAKSQIGDVLRHYDPGAGIGSRSTQPLALEGSRCSWSFVDVHPSAVHVQPSALHVQPPAVHVQPPARAVLPARGQEKFRGSPGVG